MDVELRNSFYYMENKNKTDKNPHLHDMKETNMYRKC